MTRLGLLIFVCIEIKNNDSIFRQNQSHQYLHSKKISYIIIKYKVNFEFLQ